MPRGFATNRPTLQNNQVNPERIIPYEIEYRGYRAARTKVTNKMVISPAY